MDLRVEPVLMLCMVTAVTSNLAMQQLMQDKLCLYKYGLDHEYCSSISDQENSDSKNKVLGDVGLYLSMKEYITVVPHIIIVLFSGSWCDRFPNGRRYVMMATLFGNVMESLLFLLNSIFIETDYRLMVFSCVPSALLGVGIQMAAASYITATCDASQRSFRFLRLEIFSRIGLFVGLLSNGWIMDSVSLLFPANGTRNHADVFFMNAVLQFSCILWVMFRVTNTSDLRDTSKVSDPEDVLVSCSEDGPGSSTNNNFDDESSPLIRSESGVDMTTSSTLTASSLFSSQDYKDIFATLTIDRPSNGRKNMWLVVIIYATICAPEYGFMYLAYPISELLYKWDIHKFGLVAGIMSVFTPIIVALFMTISVKLLKPNDLEVMMTGLSSKVLGLIAIGSITSQYGLYLHGLAGCLSAVTMSGIRSFLSLIIPGNEITKVFSILQLVETLMSFISPAIASIVFKATITWYPTFLYHSFAFLLIVSIAITAFIDTSRRTMLNMKSADATRDAST